MKRLTRWISVGAGVSAAQQAKVDLASNVNRKLVLENLFLTLPL